MYWHISNASQTLYSESKIIVFIFQYSHFILSGGISLLSPVVYWTPADRGDSSSSVICFCLFILFIWFSWQEYGSGLPFPSPVDHILSELLTMTHLSWVTLHGMAHSFTELCKPLHESKAVIHEGEDTIGTRNIKDYLRILLPSLNNSIN